jgi:hypothetical protein
MFNQKAKIVMIEQIKDLPPNMVGFRSTGEVKKEDFDLVTEEVKKIVDRTGKLNYLLFLDNSPSDFTLGAWLQDAFLGIRNITKWNRAAIVSDSDAVINFTNAFSILMPGEFKGFHKDEMLEAVDWTSEKIEA